MDQATKSFSRINYEIHPKLNQECQVVIEYLQLPLCNGVVFPISNITKRRESVRIQGIHVPCMREPKIRKSKKKTKNTKNRMTFLEKGCETPSDDIDLSDNEIIKLFDEVDSYIEDGFWDSATNILNGNDQESVPNTSITSIQSFSSLQPQSIPSQTMVSQATEADLQFQRSTAIQTDLAFQRSTAIQTDLPLQCSTAIQTDFDDRRSASTQTDIDYQCSNSTQTCFDHQRSIGSQTDNLITETDSQQIVKMIGTSTRKLQKRKTSTGSCGASKIFIKNYDLSKGLVNRGHFDYKIPKHSKIHLTTETNFQLIKDQVITVLKRPCLKFLGNESCSSCCPYNHVLPAAIVVAEAISNWSNQTIDFFYMTYMQRYKVCHLRYFEIICNAYAQRQLPVNILTTVKDCERMSLECHLKVILLSLVNCGYSVDDALLAICTHAYRTENTMNEIMKIIITFKVSNFKRTIAFLVTIIDMFDFDSDFGNKILKQASEVETPDVTLLEFCCNIVTKFRNILDEQYMKKLLSKM